MTKKLALILLILTLAGGQAFSQEQKGSGKNVNYTYESDGLGTIFGKKNALRARKPWQPNVGLAYSVTHRMGYNYTLTHLRYTYQADENGSSDIDSYLTEDGFWQVQLRRTNKF